MASANEVKVGSRDWVVRVSGRDVEVEVLSKNKKESGRGWEFRLKNLETGRTLTRGSGSLRRRGEPAREAPSSFGQRRRTKARAKPKKTSKRSAPKKTNPYPAIPSSLASPKNGSPRTPLPSLRGQRKKRTSTASAPAKPSRRVPKWEQEGYAHELSWKIAQALKPCKVPWQIREICVKTISDWQFQQDFGIFRR